MTIPTQKIYFFIVTDPMKIEKPQLRAARANNLKHAADLMVQSIKGIYHVTGVGDMDPAVLQQLLGGARPQETESLPPIQPRRLGKKQFIYNLKYAMDKFGDKLTKTDKKILDGIIKKL